MPLTHAFRAVLSCSALCGKHSPAKVEFAVLWLGRAYRSKQDHLMSVGKCAVPVDPETCKFRNQTEKGQLRHVLGDRSLPGVGFTEWSQEKGGNEGEKDSETVNMEEGGVEQNGEQREELKEEQKEEFKEAQKEEQKEEHKEEHKEEGEAKKEDGETKDVEMTEADAKLDNGSKTREDDSNAVNSGDGDKDDGEGVKDVEMIDVPPIVDGVEKFGDDPKGDDSEDAVSDGYMVQCLDKPLSPLEWLNSGCAHGNSIEIPSELGFPPKSRASFSVPKGTQPGRWFRLVLFVGESSKRCQTAKELGNAHKSLTAVHHDKAKVWAYKFSSEMEEKADVVRAVKKKEKDAKVAEKARLEAEQRRKEEEKEAERRRKEEEERRLLEEMGYPGFEKTKGDYDDLSFISPGPVWASAEDISRNEDFYR